MADQKPLVFICDDEEGIRESFKLILDGRYRLEFAQNGPEALEKLKDLNPAVMLLDIKMPKIHGMEILKQVKQLKPSLPVIIVTGYQSVEMAQEALRCGAKDYIPKPFESKQILEAVAQSIK